MSGAHPVRTTLDEETYRAVQAYGGAQNHRSTAETCRELIEYGLHCKTERPHASLVRQQVGEKLDAFLLELSETAEYHALSVIDAAEEAAASQIAASARIAYAALIAASEAAAAVSGQDEADVRARCLDRAFAHDGLAAQWEEGDR